jgi:hypothetical protein
LTWKEDKVKKLQEKHNNAISLEYEEDIVHEEAAVNQGSETEKIPVDPAPNYMVLLELLLLLFLVLIVITVIYFSDKLYMESI